MSANLRSKSAPQLTRDGLRSSSAATVISDETKGRIDSDLYAFKDEMHNNESRGLPPLFTRQKTVERDLDPFGSMDDDIPQLSLKQMSVEKNRHKLKNLDKLYAQGKSKKKNKGGKKKSRKTRKRKSRGGGKSIDFSQIDYDGWADNELGNEFGGVFNYGRGHSVVHSPKIKKKMKTEKAYVKQGNDDEGDFVSMGGKRRRKTRKRRKSKKRKTRKRRRRRKQRGSSFLKSKIFNPNKPMIMGMSEGTLERLQQADTSFGAVMKARNYIRNEGMDGLSAHRKAMGSHLKKKDILALPKYMEWQKKKGVQQKPIITSDKTNHPKLTRSVGYRNVLQQAGKRRRKRTRRR